MKNKLLAITSIAAALCLGACGEKEDKKDQKTVAESEIATILAIDKRNSFVTFESNKKAKPTNTLAEFEDKNQNYQVGTLNPFKLGPAMTYYDKEGVTVILDDSKPEQWVAGWSLLLKDDGGNIIDSSKYVFDDKKCEIVLSDALKGKKLTSVVTANADADKGLSQELSESFASTFTFEVVSGVNIYDAKELAYFDDRDEANGLDYGNGSGDKDHIVVKMMEFKDKNGMDRNIKAENILLHDNVVLTKDDVPADFFYTENDLNGDWKDEAKDTWIDDTFIYQHVNNTKVALNGNYFKVDASKFPLIVRHYGKDQQMGLGDAISHSSLFRLINGSAEFKNISIVGNGPNYVAEGDEKNAGGDILIKAGECATSLKISNMISISNCITVLTEKPDYGYSVMNVEINNSKFNDNYNSFLYNWGGIMDINNSYFGSCGGPIIIQDHAGVDSTGPWESQTGDVVYGYAPDTTFTNCTLSNYVTGGEAWFKQFQATSLTPTIKAMSDLYAAGGKSFVYDRNETEVEGSKTVTYTPTVYKTNAKQSATSFNFICLNKSSEAQGMTVYPVCGSIKFVNSKGESPETTLFNYLKADAIENYVTHMSLRKMNENNSPVFETAGGVGTIFSETDTSISPLNAVNQTLGALYDYASQAYVALKVLDSKGLTEEQRVRTIVSDNEYLKETLIQSAAMGTDPVTPINEYTRDPLFIDAVKSFTGQSLSDVATAEYVAEQYIYPLFRQIVLISNMYRTGKLLTEEFGLIDVVDLYRGKNSIHKDTEVSISEAVTNLFAEGHKTSATEWATFAQVGSKKIDWGMVLTIADLANKFEITETMTIEKAFSIAKQMEGAEASNAHFFDKATDYTAIYFNGMMLVMGLSNLVL